MRTFLIIAGMAVLVLLGLSAYYGGFYKVQVQVAEAGGETMAYEAMMGDYSQSKAVMDRIYKQLRTDYQIDATQGVGIYYDNPKQTPVAELRSDVGCILPADALGRAEELQSSFSVKTIDKKEYLTAEFPYRGGLSVFLNIMKTYPALEEFAQENNYNTEAPVIEIYDMPNKRIIVRMEATRMRS